MYVYTANGATVTIQEDKYPSLPPPMSAHVYIYIHEEKDQ